MNFRTEITDAMPVEAALRKMKGYMVKSGLLREIRSREAFVKPSEAARAKSKKARARARKKARLAARWEHDN